MNICKCFKCDTCGTLIDCRIGISNREVQPFQFACPVCEECISFIIGHPDGTLKGAEDIVDFDGPFKGENPFVDLHLDFPAYFGEYKMGETTFIRVVGELGEDAYFHLAQRLEVLNRLLPMQRDLQRIITQYKRGDIDKLDGICDKIPGVTLRSHKKQDVLAALYSATSIMSSPFTIHEQNEELSTELPSLYQWLHAHHHDKTVAFIDEILANNFLQNLHQDCLSLYPKLIELDLPFRATFFYDYVKEGEYSPVAARISTADFDTCNNFYKDLAEVFSRQLILLAGLNNLLHRGDHNEFEPSLKVTRKNEPRREAVSLNAFADADLGTKLQFIDKCFYKVDETAIDNRLRNGIAHYKYEYKESTQVITYYPFKEGMNREKAQEITFIEFVRKSLLLFREVHNLNHLIKTTLYYCVLVLKKDF